MRLIAFLLAVSFPILWNKPLPPAVTDMNQIAAVVGWGTLLCVFPAATGLRRNLRAAWPVVESLALCALACAWTLMTDALSTDPWVPTLGMLLIGILVVLHGASAGLHDPVPAFKPFAIALVAAGAGSALVGNVQIFAPDWADGEIISRTAWLNRASGNIGQPNHLADLLVWSLAATVPLAQERRGGWHGRAVAAVLAAAALFIVLAIVATSSRTGIVGIGLLTAWGLADRRLAKGPRIALWLLPAATAAIWFGVQQWAHAKSLPFSLSARVGNGDVSAFRFNIWHDALALIAQNPWIGVGWGNFNFAWTLTPFGFRPEGPTDNAHDLPLHLAVELGAPCALIILSLLVAAMWLGFRRTRRLGGVEGATAGCALVMVMQIGMHSLLEYPLWYVYLMYPVGWAWGWLLGCGLRAKEAAAADPATVPASAQAVAAVASGPAIPRGRPARRAPGAKADREAEPAPAPEPAAAAVIGAQTAAERRRARLWRLCGALLMVSGVLAYFDYMTVVMLFVPNKDSPPLPERIVNGQASLLFGTKADYVLAAQAPDPVKVQPAIERASRVLLNGRLMFVWANALAERGQVDKARFMAARLHEFDVPPAVPFFKLCEDPKVAAMKVKPFQCEAPVGRFTWRDFR
jgi:O-antigen ligase